MTSFFLFLDKIEKIQENFKLRFCLFDSLRPSQQSFSYVGTDLAGLNQY